MIRCRSANLPQLQIISEKGDLKVGPTKKHIFTLNLLAPSGGL
jgi:hypothetical protein